MSGNKSRGAWRGPPSTLPPPPHTSLAEVPKSYKTKAEQVSATYSPAGRAAQNHSSAHHLLQNFRSKTLRTSTPALAKLTTTQTFSGEFHRSSTQSNTPRSAKVKEFTGKLVDTFFDTSVGQQISDRLAPHIERGTVLGVPSDNHHSRDSYVEAAFTLWKFMQSSATDLPAPSTPGPSIEPDRFLYPTWTRPDAETPHLPPLPPPEPEPIMATSEIAVDYRVPIQQALKALTYNGHKTTDSASSPSSSLVPDEHGQSSKATTYHGKGTTQISDGRLAKGKTYTAPHRVDLWRTDSNSRVSHYKNYGKSQSDIIIKTAGDENDLPTEDAKTKTKAAYLESAVERAKAAAKAQRQTQVIVMPEDNVAKFKHTSKSLPPIKTWPTDEFTRNTKPPETDTQSGTSRAPTSMKEVKQTFATNPRQQVIRRKPVANLKAATTYPGEQRTGSTDRPSKLPTPPIRPMREPRTAVRPRACKPTLSNDTTPHLSMVTQQEAINDALAQLMASTNNAAHKDSRLPIPKTQDHNDIPLTGSALSPKARTYKPQDAVPKPAMNPKARTYTPKDNAPKAAAATAVHTHQKASYRPYRRPDQYTYTAYNPAVTTDPRILNPKARTFTYSK